MDMNNKVIQAVLRYGAIQILGVEEEYEFYGFTEKEFEEFIEKETTQCPERGNYRKEHFVYWDGGTHDEADVWYEGSNSANEILIERLRVPSEVWYIYRLPSLSRVPYRRH
jgi:hypothetical protein